MVAEWLLLRVAYMHTIIIVARLISSIQAACVRDCHCRDITQRQLTLTHQNIVYQSTEMSLPVGA